MDLRPHHLLCIQKFTGHGYDERFTEHMKSLADTLADAPDTEIRMARGCDDLCGMCPHNESGCCTSAEMVESMDASVTELCGISYDEPAPWSSLARNARERILGTPEFEYICASCQWFELCRNTEV